MTSPSHHTPTPFDDPLREAVELAKRINRRLSERFQPPANPSDPTPDGDGEATRADGEPGDASTRGSEGG